MSSEENNQERRRAAEVRIENLVTDNGGTIQPVGGVRQDALRNAIQLENIASLFELLLPKVQGDKNRAQKP